MESKPLAKKKHPRRAGILALELLFVLPILLGLLLAMVEFSLLLSARQQVTIAAREGVRVAALGGGQSDVKTVVDLVLARRTGQFRVTIARENGDPLEPGDPMEIVVSAPASEFVPDLLKFLGFSLRNTSIVGRAVMLKE